MLRLSALSLVGVFTTGGASASCGCSQEMIDMKQCTREGCDKPHLAKGLCNAHYRQERRRAANPEGKRGRPPRWSPEDLEFAHVLLEDGASYRETARSTPVPRTTLRDKFPDMGWDTQTGGKFALGFMRDPKLYTMQQEIGLLQG